MDSRQSPWIGVLLTVFGISYCLNGVTMLFASHTWFFKLIPGVPDTGPYNSHLVADIGTFYVPLGIGLLIAARDQYRHALVVAVAAGASVFHALLHIYSDLVGLLSTEHLGSELVMIHVPTVVLCILAVMAFRQQRAETTRTAAVAIAR